MNVISDDIDYRNDILEIIRKAKISNSFVPRESDVIAKINKCFEILETFNYAPILDYGTAHRIDNPLFKEGLDEDDDYIYNFVGRDQFTEVHVDENLDRVYFFTELLHIKLMRKDQGEWEDDFCGVQVAFVFLPDDEVYTEIYIRSLRFVELGNLAEKLRTPLNFKYKMSDILFGNGSLTKGCQK